MKYTVKSTLKDILSHKRAQEILEKFNVPCLGCAFAQMEMEKLTIGAICQMYDLDLKGILSELNAKQSISVKPAKANKKKKSN